MSNYITIELCAEDRARLDKYNQLIEAQITSTLSLIDVINERIPARVTAHIDDDLTKKLQAVVDRAKTPTESVDAPTLTTTPTKEETPTKVEETEPTPVKTISRTELGAKVRELMTKGLREQVKAVIQSYAPTVPGVPGDKLNECYEKLVALEVK